MIVGFAPQSIGEAGAIGVEGEFPVAAALSGPSRIAFRVPANLTEVPFDLKGLLDWTALTPSLAANAIGFTDPRPVPAPGLAAPPATATAIEAPYRLVLSPGPQGRWAFARTAVTRAGVSELWHVRLVARLAGSESDRILRPIWTPDMTGGPAPVPTLPNADQRRLIVNLGGDLRGTGNPPKPVVPKRLELSVRGAWFEGDGAWDFPDPPSLPAFLDVDVIAQINDSLAELRLLPPRDPQELEDEKLFRARQVVDSAIPGGIDQATEVAMKRALIEPLTQDPGEAGRLLKKLLDELPPRARFEWSHRMLQGRDDSARTVTPGFLLPWGHAVDLIEEVAREFVGGNLFCHAALVKRASIRVRESARSFPMSQYPNAGRETPFVSCRLTGDLTRPIRRVPATSTPIWMRTPDDATDLMWTVVCTDRAFMPVTMTMALLFVPQTLAEVPGGAAAAWTAYTSDARSSVDLGGQSVTLTEGDARGTTKLAVHTMSFAGATQSASSSMPKIAGAEVSVAAVDAMLGTAGAAGRAPLKFHKAYLQAGFDAAANPSQVFADLRSAAEGLDITSLPERAGGLLRPDLEVQGLSKVLGPVPDVENVVRGVLDPTSFIPDVKILGGYSLKALVAPILSGLTPGNLGALADLDPAGLWDELQKQVVTLPLPSLTARRIGPVERPDAVETRFVWKPPLNLAALLPSGLKLDPGARLVVMSTSRAPLDGSAPTFESKGVLANFAIHFAGVVKVQLAALTFVARAGRKLELDATGVKLSFEGPLAFVERIRQYIPPEGFSDPPSVVVSPTGISAGYSLGLPTIGVGVFSLENVGLSAAFELPFVDGPTRLRFALSERHDPFLVTVSLFGGGGFLGITVDTEGAVGVEGALEFGGNFCLDLVVASGGVHVMAGIYFKMAGTVVELSGYLRVGGAVTVLGVITVSVEFYLALTYHHDDGPPPLNKVMGDAVLTVGVDVLFLHQDVTLHVHREFANPVGDPTFEDLVSLEAWTTYCHAYAA